MVARAMTFRCHFAARTHLDHRYASMLGEVPRSERAFNQNTFQLMIGCFQCSKYIPDRPPNKQWFWFKHHMSIDWLLSQFEVKTFKCGAVALFVLSPTAASLITSLGLPNNFSRSLYNYKPFINKNSAPPSYLILRYPSLARTE